MATPNKLQTTPSPATMDPRFQAMHAASVAQRGGEKQGGHWPVLQNDAMKSNAKGLAESIAKWDAMSESQREQFNTQKYVKPAPVGTNMAPAPQVKAPAPNPDMEAWKEPNQPPLVTKVGPIIPSVYNGATSRGAGVASFPTGTVIDQPGGSKQLVSKYGTGSSVMVPKGQVNYDKAHVFDGGKPVLTSAAKAAGVIGYDPQGNAIRAQLTAPAAQPNNVLDAWKASNQPPLTTPAPQPQATPTATSFAPKVSPTQVLPSQNQPVNDLVASIKQGGQTYDPNNAQQRQQFARPQAMPAVMTPAPKAAPDPYEIAKAKQDLAQSQPGLAKVGGVVADALTGVVKLGNAAKAAVTNPITSVVKGGVNWLLGDRKKADAARKKLRSAAPGVKVPGQA